MTRGMSGFRMLVLMCFLAVGAVSGCAPPKDASGGAVDVEKAREEAPVSLTVFAAASLAEVFEAVARAFERRHDGVEVVLHLAGSQQLANQIRLGAPADVFASANWQQMQVAVEAGRIDPTVARPFARNRLVVVLPRGNPAGLARLQDLTRPGVKLVLAAEEVPVGQYTRRFLEDASRDSVFGVSFAEGVLSRVVSYEQNVRAVLTKVMLGEADAGIVYASDLAGFGPAEIGRIEIPPDLSPEALYPIAAVSDGPQSDLADAFVDFVCSAEGQDILAQYGFLAVPS